MKNKCEYRRFWGHFLRMLHETCSDWLCTFHQPFLLLKHKLRGIAWKILPVINIRVNLTTVVKSVFLISATKQLRLNRRGIIQQVWDLKFCLSKPLMAFSAVTAIKCYWGSVWFVVEVVVFPKCHKLPMNALTIHHNGPRFLPIALLCKC